MVAGGRSRQVRVSLLGLSTWVGVACLPLNVTAQFGPSSRYELSEVIYLDEVDNAARTHLTHLDQYSRAAQWDEALDTLRLLLETYDEKLLDVGQRRYISVRDYCHQRLAALPPEVLARYRLSADPQAQAWYEQGVKNREPQPLRQIVERLFASSYGDDALYALGELALERGDHSAARDCWRKILPAEQRIHVGGPNDTAATLLAFPDASFSPAEINARLVLVSILEGDLDRAAQELTQYAERFADETGTIAGRQGKYAELLAAQLESGRAWPAPSTPADWHTFGGSFARSKVAPETLDVGAKQWEAPLPEAPFNELLAFGPGPVLRRVATSHPLQRQRQRVLSHHPIVINGLVLANTSEEIYAFDLRTGRPAWEQTVIFEESVPIPARSNFRSGGPGVPRFSMTAHDGRLYARMGSPLTMSLDEPVTNERRGYLVCLDLKAQGRLLWKIHPEQEKFAFDGAPVTDGANIYIALRRSDVRPQAHVACYDAQTGRRRWIRQVCSAETIGRGQYEETTFNLLTLHSGSLYLNTNLGAVAKLSAHDGHVDWIKVYREPLSGELRDLNQPSTYLHRDLTPCLYDAGRLFVAPSDNERIYALNAETGELLWDTRYTPDAVHLLGVGQGNLLASGDRLYWINCETGKLVRYWPDTGSPKGYGRGILAGNNVYWPTRTSIYVFDQATGQLQREIDLRGRDERATAGNLLIADGMLLVAAADRLIAYSQNSQLGNVAPAALRTTEAPQSEQTQ